MQTKLVAVAIQVPPLPEHLLTADGHTLPLNALTPDGVRALSEAYTAQLLTRLSPGAERSAEAPAPSVSTPALPWPPAMVKVGPSTVLLPDYGLMFDATAPQQARNQEHAQQLARECRVGGHSDWRLPESHELQLLIRHDRHQPAIDTDYFPHTPISDWYWTNTPRTSDPAYAWGVYFNNGDVGNYHRDGSGFVRAVRRVPVVPASQ